MPQAAQREGRAPFDPKDVIDAADLDDYDPNQLLIVTTGSQVCSWLLCWGDPCWTAAVQLGQRPACCAEGFTTLLGQV